MEVMWVPTKSDGSSGEVDMDSSFTAAGSAGFGGPGGVAGTWK